MARARYPYFDRFMNRTSVGLLGTFAILVGFAFGMPNPTPAVREMMVTVGAVGVGLTALADLHVVCLYAYDKITGTNRGNSYTAF